MLQDTGAANISHRDLARPLFISPFIEKKGNWESFSPFKNFTYFFDSLERRNESKNFWTNETLKINNYWIRHCCMDISSRQRQQSLANILPEAVCNHNKWPFALGWSTLLVSFDILLKTLLLTYEHFHFKGRITNYSGDRFSRKKKNNCSQF